MSVKLTIDEVLQLDAEINGFTNQQSGEVVYKGFANHELPILLKYELSELTKTLQDERSKVDELRNSLITKYGDVKEDGSVEIKPTVEVKKGKKKETVKNEKYVEFLGEYGKLLSKEIEIDTPEITKDDLKEVGKTTDQYKVLFKLIT
jgi:hypothetical protein